MVVACRNMNFACQNMNSACRSMVFACHNMICMQEHVFCACQNMVFAKIRPYAVVVYSSLNVNLTMRRRVIQVSGHYVCFACSSFSLGRTAKLYFWSKTSQKKQSKAWPKKLPKNLFQCVHPEYPVVSIAYIWAVEEKVPSRSFLGYNSVSWRRIGMNSGGFFLPEVPIPIFGSSGEHLARKANKNIDA